MLVKNFITIMFCYQWWWNKVSYRTLQRRGTIKAA